MESRLEFGQHLIDLGLIREGVEIGVLFGEYSECLLSTWPGVLNLVDPWIQQPSRTYKDGCNSVDFDEAIEITRNRLKRYEDRVRFWRMFSTDAAAHFKDGSLSFVYIDGNHSYNSAKADIQAWLGKVEKGGILGGHDYYDIASHYQNCGVKSAVDEFVNLHNLKLQTTECTSWWITKP
jgi:hypothetical protein